VDEGGRDERGRSAPGSLVVSYDAGLSDRQAAAPETATEALGLLVDTFLRATAT
jgi:hypothetical protein